jgi:hypothetical protein
MNRGGMQFFSPHEVYCVDTGVFLFLILVTVILIIFVLKMDMWK